MSSRAGARRTLSELQSPLGNQLTHRNRTTRREPDGFCFREKKSRALPPQNPKKGLTIVPLSVYNKRFKLKLGIAIARGKKKEDKRHSIRAREEKRRIDRTLKTK